MLTLRPITMQDAKAVVGKWHRHNRPPLSGLYAVAAEVSGEVVGVVTAGRPVARPLDDGWTVELTRNCTDGHRNAEAKVRWVWPATARAELREVARATEVA